MNILGIIPARGGSKRVSGKNMRTLGGKPLVAHIIESSIKSKLLDKVIVSSDNKSILALEEQYSPGDVTFIPRPDEISGDNSPAIEYVQHTLDWFKKDGINFDVIVILQPSSPLTLPEDIDGTIKLLLESKSDSSVSVVKLAHQINPIKLKIMEGDKLVPFIDDEKGRMMDGELPDVYIRNCSVYATLASVINKGIIIGDDCRGYIMPRERSVDINDEFDFEFAEFLYSKRIQN